MSARTTVRQNELDAVWQAVEDDNRFMELARSMPIWPSRTYEKRPEQQKPRQEKSKRMFFDARAPCASVKLLLSRVGGLGYSELHS
jgi:hypothetical protein